MRQMRGALDLAIKQLGHRDQGVIDKLLHTIDKMADALRPAARQAVTPIGETAKTLSIDAVSGDGPVVRIGKAEKDAINADEPLEITAEQDYHVYISEIDTENGTCKVRLTDNIDKRYDGRITDPAISTANNNYVLALSS